MHITLLTIGSRGDVQPLIALGLGLQQAGHTVRLATHANFESLIRKRGLDFALIRMNPQELLQGEAGQATLKTGGNTITFMRRYAEMLEPVMEAVLIDSWEACQGTDAIIAGSIAFWGWDIAQKLEVPFYLAELYPLTSPTKAFPIATTPPELGRLSGLYNRFSYFVMWHLFWQLFRKPINQWRQSTLNLPPTSSWQSHLRLMEQQEVPFLCGYSSAVIPKPEDWLGRINITGYWFLESTSEFSPPQALVDFLMAGSPPVYIGFGSMAGREPEVTTEIVLAALKKTGQRGILLTGWSGISNADLPDNLFKVESIPHDWLFPKMSAIVHHGGAGTASAAFRAGVPAVIIPFFGDQPFWAYRAAQLGVSPKPIPRKELTVERLAAAIAMAVNDERMRSRAAALGQKICSENGVAQAVEAFHKFILHGKLYRMADKGIKKGGDSAVEFSSG